MSGERLCGGCGGTRFIDYGRRVECSFCGEPAAPTPPGTGELRRWSCSYCGAARGSEGQLRQHMSKAHPDEGHGLASTPPVTGGGDAVCRGRVSPASAAAINDVMASARTRMDGPTITLTEAELRQILAAHGAQVAWATKAEAELAPAAAVPDAGAPRRRRGNVSSNYEMPVTCLHCGGPHWGDECDEKVRTIAWLRRAAESPYTADGFRRKDMLRMFALHDELVAMVEELARHRHDKGAHNAFRSVVAGAESFETCRYEVCEHARALLARAKS